MNMSTMFSRTYLLFQIRSLDKAIATLDEYLGKNEEFPLSEDERSNFIEDINESITKLINEKYKLIERLKAL